MRASERNRIEWHVQGYIAALSLVTGAAGYMAGYVRGEAFGERTEIKTVVETVEYPPSYAATCSLMLEAAWDIDNPALPPLASSPHDP